MTSVLTNKKSKSEVDIRNKIAQKHSRLVHKIVHRMQNKCREPYDDLYQQGFIGLLKAVENFDPSLGNSFSSFAVPYIQGAIQHYLRDDAPGLKIPRSALEKVQKVKRLRKQFELAGRQLDEEAIAVKLGLSIQEWESLQALTKKTVISWDELPYEPLIDDFIEDEDNNSSIYQALSKLDAGHRHILLQRFFLGKQLTEVAQMNKLSIEQVNFLLQEAIAILNHQLQGIYGDCSN